MALTLPNQRSLLTGFFGRFLWLIAVLKTPRSGISAGSVVLIAGMQPVLTALIARHLLAKCNHPYQWLGVFAGFVGVAVVVWCDAKFSGTQLVMDLLSSIATISLTTITIIERRGAGIIFAIFFPPVTMLVALPVFGGAPSLHGFVGLFITARGFLLIHRGEQASAYQTS